MTIELCWQGPLDFKDLIASRSDREKFNFPGLYLWKTAEPQRKIIYVGKSQGSVYQRLAQEYLLFVSGAFKIPAHFRQGQNDWEYDLSSDGSLDELFDEERFLKLARAGFRFANSIEIFVSEMKSGPAIGQAERLLMYNLKPERNVRGVNSLPSDLRLKVINRGEFEAINGALSANARVMQDEYLSDGT